MDSSDNKGDFNPWQVELRSVLLQMKPASVTLTDRSRKTAHCGRCLKQEVPFNLIPRSCTR